MRKRLSDVCEFLGELSEGIVGIQTIIWLSWAVLLTVLLVVVSACSPFTTEPRPGPDKQGSGLVSGAAIGAGLGAITGAQIAAASGPGAAIGAGLGAAFGSISGLGTDLIEEDQLRQQDEQQYAREISWVQEVLFEHYQRRIELHPSRDIFPADLFFDNDSTELRESSRLLVRELAYLTQRRMPWSPIVVAAYVTSEDPESTYAKFLSKRRAEEIAHKFIRYGFEPRRVYTRAVTLPEPVLIDPDDSPSRYRQAIEIIALEH